MEMQVKVGVPTERFGESGNVLILVGGTDSDRALAARIMGFQGTKLHVEQLEAQIQRKSDFVRKMNWAFYMRYGRFLKEMSMEKPDDVKTLHEFCDALNLDESGRRQFVDGMNRLLLKPNVMLELENFPVFEVGTCSEAGYAADRIHIAWILNDQDAEKSFADILSRAHSLSDIWSEWPIANGTMWVFSCRPGVDTGRADVLRIKEAGKSMPDLQMLMDMKWQTR